MNTAPTRGRGRPAKPIVLDEPPADPYTAIPLCHRGSLSLDNAGVYLGVCRETIKALVKRGELTVYPIGTRRLIPRWVLDEFIASRYDAANPHEGATR